MTTTTTEATATERVLSEMLHENTGIHMMDSGFGNGRAWQQNAGVDLIAGPRSYMGHCGPTLSTLHYLADRVEFAPVMQRLFDILMVDSKASYLHDADDFATAMHDGREPVRVYNTYNEDTILSQDFQWWEFTHDGEDYVVISSHNGADIRGGYSKANVFTVTASGGLGGQMSDAIIYCENRDCEFGVELYGSDIVDHDGHSYTGDLDLWADDVKCPDCGSALGVDAPEAY